MYKPFLLTIGTVLENAMLGNQGDPERQIIHDSVYISSFFSVLWYCLLPVGLKLSMRTRMEIVETFRCKQIR